MNSVDEDRCTGCGICELWCMHRHEGERRLARIRIFDRKGLVGRRIEVCRQCEDRPCLDACPEVALSVHSRTGAIVVSADQCIGCGECAGACKYGAIRIIDDVAVVCDLCGGEPACVENCPEKVLSIK